MEARQQRAKSARSQAERAIVMLLITALGVIWFVGIWGASRTEYDSRLLLVVILGAVTTLITALGLRALTQVTAVSELARNQQDSEHCPAQSQRTAKLLPPTIQHDLRTPTNLILGFCDTILTSVHGYDAPLPVSYRRDVESIQRNARRVQELIEVVLDAVQPEAKIPALRVRAATHLPETAEAHPSDTSKSMLSGVIIVAEDSSTIELFKRYMTQYSVIGVRRVEEIGRLDIDTCLGVIVTNERNHNRVPEIAHLVGEETPILTCSLTSFQELIAKGTNTDFLAKPVTLESLSRALARLGGPAPDILVIDDNRDNVEMFSRMIDALPQPTRLWKTYSGREGLALLREQHIDLVILDLVLPDMEGLALALFLRTEPSLASIPLLLISSYQETVVASSAVLGKISVYELAGFQIPDLIRHLELLVSQFNQAR